MLARCGRHKLGSVRDLVSWYDRRVRVLKGSSSCVEIACNKSILRRRHAQGLIGGIGPTGMYRKNG